MGILDLLRPRQPAPPAEPAAKAETPTREDLIAPAGVAPSSLTSHRYFNGLYDRNPDALRQRVTAVTSTVGNYDVIFSRDIAFYDLTAEMRRDPLLGWLLDVIVGQIEGRAEYIGYDDDDDDLPLDEKDERARIQAFVEDNLLGMDARFGWNQFKHQSIWGRMADGFSATEIRWTLDHQPVDPDLPPVDAAIPLALIQVHPSTITFNDLGDAFLYRDVFGQATQRAQTFNPIPDWRLVIVGSPGAYGNPFGESLLYDLAPLWAARKSALKEHIRFNEQYGTPLAVGHMKEGASDKPGIRSRLISLFQDLRHNAGVVIDDDTMILEWIQRSAAGSTGSSPFMPFVEYTDTLIIQRILGAVLGVREGQFGTRAQATVHKQTQDEKGKPLAVEFRDAVNRLIRTMVRVQFGDDAPCPKYEIDIEDALDQALGMQILDMAQQIGMEVPRSVAHDWLGIRQPSEGESILEPMPQPVPMTQPAMQPQPSQFAESKKKDFARFNALADSQLSLKDKLDELIEQTASEDVRRLAESILARVRSIPGAAGDPITQAAATRLVGAIEDFALSAELETLFAAADVAGSASVIRALTDQGAPSDAIDALTQGPVDPRYGDAVEWMRNRRVATADELSELNRAAAAASKGKTAEEIERAVRENVLVIKNSIDAETTVRIRESVARAVDEGRTIGEFMDDNEKLIAEGKIIGGGNAQLQTVYRTEMANAFAKQQEATLEDPELTEMVWGFEFFNPDDSFSRPSHADMDGVRVRIGSAEARAAGNTPWSYNCRCSRVVLIGGPGDYTQTPDAMSRIQRIERF